MNFYNDGNLTTIFLIQHAQPQFEQDLDESMRPLSLRGEEEAQAIGIMLQDERLHSIFCDPAEYVKETALFAGIEARAVVSVMELLREKRIDSDMMYDYEGFVRRRWEDFTYFDDDGESMAALQERCARFVTDLLNKYRRRNVAIIAHAVPLGVIIRQYKPDFEYTQLASIMANSPFIVRADFDGDRCASMLVQHIHD